MGSIKGSEEAAAAVQRALLSCMGPAAAEQLALAQVRLAWDEVVNAAGLARGGMVSRLARLSNGTGYVEASEPILAQELTLRSDALVRAVNERMRGRPGATMELRRLAISVGRLRSGRTL
jgi:Dna[CI] antecedent, DciA